MWPERESTLSIKAYERGADITMIGGMLNGLGLSMIRR